MLVISYDISNGKLRTRFSKFLQKSGAIRLQYSVYEVVNVNRLLDNLIEKITADWSPKFGGGDSVLIFDVDKKSVKKFGNAIHRDTDVVYFS